MGFAPAVSEVALLLDATDEPGTIDYTLQTPSGKTVSGRSAKEDYRYYVVTFKTSGEYKATFSLPGNYEYRKIAEIGNGEFVLLAYDPVNRVASLRRVDSSGRDAGVIPIPAGMVHDDEL
jgi:hypothetical protein